MGLRFPARFLGEFSRKKPHLHVQHHEHLLSIHSRTQKSSADTMPGKLATTNPAEAIKKFVGAAVAAVLGFEVRHLSMVSSNLHM